MRRILFQWRGITIHAYPAFLFLGVVAGVIAGSYAATLRGLDAARILAAMLVLVVPALVGARLLFAASHWQIFRQDPGRIWRSSEGGADMYGGLILAFLLSLPLLAIMAIPLGVFWDLATITMLIGMVFTRIGCLLNGCCAGRPTHGPLALYLPNVHGVWCRRLPTQLLEASLGAVLLAGSVAVWNTLPFDGALFLGNLAAYGIGRWGLELTRENIDKVGGVALQRALSVGFVAIALAGFLFIGPGTEGRLPAAEVEPGPGMSAWQFLLAPLGVLAVLLLFRFVGCAAIADISDATYDNPYQDEVKNDGPVAYWRLHEVPPPTPGVVKAANEVGGTLHLHDGTYSLPTGPVAEDLPHHSAKANPLVLKLDATPGLLEKDSSAHAVHINGGFIRVPGASDLNPSNFTLECLVSPDFDQTQGNYFCLLESSNLPAAGQMKKLGYAIYAGPVDPTNPSSPYHWQLWVGNGSTFVQLIEKPVDRGINDIWSVHFPTTGTYTLTFKGQTTPPIAHNANDAAVRAALEGLSTIGAGNVIVFGQIYFEVMFFKTLGNAPQTLTGSSNVTLNHDVIGVTDLGPKVEKEPTYLVLTCDGTKCDLFIYTHDRNLDFVHYPLVPLAAPYQANDGTSAPATDLLIGIVEKGKILTGPLPGPNQLLYPFSGKIQEVAIYKKVLSEERILSHAMAAFNT